MFWYFLAGFISGIVGMLMLGKHFADKGIKKDDERP